MNKNYTRATPVDTESHQEFESDNLAESKQSDPTYAYIQTEEVSKGKGVVGAKL